MKMVMPKMGMTMEEGTIVEWKKKDGEYVNKGDVILEIMTNKVNIDVEAPASGYLTVMRGPDEVIPVGEVIALIGETPGMVEGAEAPLKEVPEIEVSVPPEKIRVPATPRARKLAEEKGILLEEILGTGPDGAVTEADVMRRIERMKPQEIHVEEQYSGTSVSPLAERIAHEKGVDLSKVRGTGIDGKITKEDVLKYIEMREGRPERYEKPSYPPIEERKRPEEVPTPRPEPHEVKPQEVKPQEVKPITEPQVRVTEKPEIRAIPPEIEGIPLTGIRKLTAERMLKSKREAPHLTLFMEVDMTEASKLKTSLSVSYTAILVRAAALALKKHPLINSTLRENRIVLRDSINIGVATARGEDLIVPVITKADTLSLKRISDILSDLITRVQKDQLSEKDVLGGTFTISNLGMYDIDFFTPIINPPEAAILGAGRIRKVPVVIEDQIEITEVIFLSLSFDHRIVNGMPASLFLKDVKDLLENPYRLLVEGEP